jgi:hypothetical protein
MERQQIPIKIQSWIYLTVGDIVTLPKVEEISQLFILEQVLKKETLLIPNLVSMLYLPLPMVLTVS